MPATSPSHVELLEWEIRAVARIIIGCPLPGPVHVDMAEAGLEPVASHRKTVAARLLAKALALPAEDPSEWWPRQARRPDSRSAADWRTVGRSIWDASGIAGPIEPTATRRALPWQEVEGVTFDLSVGTLPVAVAPRTQK